MLFIGILHVSSSSFPLMLKETTVYNKGTSHSKFVRWQPPLCSSGTVWQELHIKAGGTVGLQLSGRGDEIIISCLSGFIWDLFSGHPKAELRLYNIDTAQYIDLTAQVNQTYYTGSPLTYKSSKIGSWGLQFINHNSLWNADFTLVIDYFIRPSPPNCPVCANRAGFSGPYCNETCSANCYECCQNNKNMCTVCAAGTWNLPTCGGTCLANCLYCDDMGGCHICKNASVSGPKCDGCRPAPCRQPYLADCATQCEDHYLWCDMCRDATKKASEIIQILAEAYQTEKLAEAAIVTATIACGFLSPIVAVGCEFTLTTIVEAGVTKFVISWLFKEAANQVISRSFCSLIHLCSGPAAAAGGEGLLVLPSNTTLYIP